MTDAETFLHLTTRGRTSGLPRTIEIWFVEHAGRYYVVSERREESHWVRNLRADAGVAFSVGSRTARDAEVARANATARVLHDVEDAALAAAVRALMDAKYDWSDGLVVEVTPV